MFRTSIEPRARLRLGVRLATVGSWRSTNKLLKRFDKQSRQSLKRAINVLLNRLREHEIRCTNILWPSSILSRMLEFVIPALAEASPTSNDLMNNLKALEELIGCLTERGLYIGANPRDHEIPVIARSLTPEQFLAAISLAHRLADQGINPRLTLLYGIPAVAKTSSGAQIFQSNLKALEELVTLVYSLNGQRTRCLGALWYGLPAIAEHLAPEQFSQAVALAVRLAKAGIDPAVTLLHGLPAVAKASPTEAAEYLPQALALAMRFAEAGIDPAATLQHGLPAVAKASPTAEVFRSNLSALESLSRRLAEAGIDPAATLQHGLPAVAKASPTAEVFRSNLSALESLSRRLAEAGIDSAKTMYYGISALESLSRRLAEAGIDSAKTMYYGIPVVAKASPTEAAEYLPQAVALAVRLAEAGIDPAATLQHGLPAVAKASPTAEVFRSNLSALESLSRRLAEAGIDSAETMRYGIPVVAKALSPEQFGPSLDILYEIAACRPLNQIDLWVRVRADELVGLVDRAMKLRQDECVYEVEVRPEKGHWEDSYPVSDWVVDSYQMVRLFIPRDYAQWKVADTSVLLIVKILYAVHDFTTDFVARC